MITLMKPSAYQQGILNWAIHSDGNGICRAVAGSGKTTTLQMVAHALKAYGYRINQIKVVVFGKANAEDMIAKFGKEWEPSIKTMHSIGWSAIRRYQKLQPDCLSKNKYWEICQNWIPPLLKDKIIKEAKDLIKIIDLVRLTNKVANGMVTPENLANILMHYSIDIVATEIIDTLNHALTIGLEMAERGELFDFTDQIWLPVYWNLPIAPCRFVLADECQDQNECQTQIMLKLAGDGRCLAVGDPYQAIMGFAGADSDSYWKIKSAINATELPLSVCYRCPTSVIALVNALYPEIGIEGGNANVGKIHTIDDPERHLHKGDLVICRTTAPLVTLCIRLIVSGKNARVRGKDLGETLKKELDGIAEQPRFRFSELTTHTKNYLAQKIDILKTKPNSDEQIDNLSDRINAILAIWENHPELQSINQIKEWIDRIFTDNSTDYDLCTAHRAKGLEANRVFILEYHKLPKVKENMAQWQVQQENNLHYVALTRTKQELFLCQSDSLPRS